MLYELSDSEHADLTEDMMKEIIVTLGEEYASVSEEEQRAQDFFIWVGCGCHKDLNTVKGGNAGMMAWWSKNDVEGPVLLANKDNAAVLQNIRSEENATHIEQRAIDSSSWGGIKAASIGGAIFNNKDDKKGQDTYKFWFEGEGISLNFPDTSNTQYGTHCDAAAVLIEHKDKFLEFIEFVCNWKDKRSLTNMEKNLKAALQCIPTPTELVVLALHGQAISHHYMHQICGENMNMLDQG
jgi:hypothetical protein